MATQRRALAPTHPQARRDVESELARVPTRLLRLGVRRVRLSSVRLTVAALADTRHTALKRGDSRARATGVGPASGSIGTGGADVTTAASQTQPNAASALAPSSDDRATRRLEDELPRPGSRALPDACFATSGGAHTPLSATPSKLGRSPTLQVGWVTGVDDDADERNSRGEGGEEA